MKYILVINTSVTCVVYVLENYAFFVGGYENFDIWENIHFIPFHSLYDEENIKVEKKENLSHSIHLYFMCVYAVRCSTSVFYIPKNTKKKKF